MTKQEILRKLKEVAGTLSNASIEKWKADGGKVLGYTCSFVPEELIQAAGALPVRIRATGSSSTEMGDDYFVSANICSLVRHTFNTIMTGHYDFLDGIIVGGGCDANRHIYDNLKRSPLKIPFLETIFFPHGSSQAMSDFFRKELEALKLKIEKQYNITISGDHLRDAIRSCNETRQLQGQLYDLNRSDHPMLMGSEMTAIMVSGSSLPREEYNTLLKQLLDWIKSNPVAAGDNQARLMLIGPGNDDPAICLLIEELGGAVVNDLTCFGGKMIVGSVDENHSDPLQAISDYQVLTRPLCPKNLGAQAHINRIVQDRIREFRIDGVIGQNFLCCDMWGGAQFILSKELKQIGIPILRIEREYPMDSVGQLRTRIQAFLETIKGGTI